MNKQIMIDPFSGIPLYVEVIIGESKTITSNGTGFIMLHNSMHYLITNWHIVTARNAETEKPMSDTCAADPKIIKIYCHSSVGLGQWVCLTANLLDKTTGRRKWLEHPKGREIDVVALPLFEYHKDIKFNPMDRNLASTDLIITPSEPVSIIGFPFGRSSSGYFPIWKTGHIASDIDIDYNNKPVFLIDATTTSGMSGAPVIAKRLDSSRSSKGLDFGSGACIKFMGVYSGRIHADSAIGMVWKPNVIDEILNGVLLSPAQIISPDMVDKYGTGAQHYTLAK